MLKRSKHHLLYLAGLPTLTSLFGVPSLDAKPLSSTSGWNLSLEGGGEYDSNVHRLEAGTSDVAPTSGGLVRTGARYRTLWQKGEQHQLRLDLRGLSKVFTSAAGQSENLGVLFADARYGHTLGKSNAVFGLQATHYDSVRLRPFGDGTEPLEERNFRTTYGEASLLLPNKTGDTVSIGAGFRDFVYKPKAAFNWRGEQLSLRYARVLWLDSGNNPREREEATSIDLRAAYTLNHRRYNSNACVQGTEIAPSCYTQRQRRDLHHSFFLEGIYTSDSVYSLMYNAQYNDSNSYGQASLRQRIEASVTKQVPGDIFLTATATIRFNTFLDPLLLAQDDQGQDFVSVEEENRNSLQLHAARDFGEHWGVESRVVFYRNEFATKELRFRRQTGYLGLIYRYAGS